MEVEKFQSHKGIVLKDIRFIFFLLALTPATMVDFDTGVLPLYCVRLTLSRILTFGMLTAVNTVLIIFIEVPLNTAMTKNRLRKSHWHLALYLSVWDLGQQLL